MRYNISFRKLGAVIAVAKGYRIKNGQLFNGAKKLVNPRIDDGGYPVIGIKLPRTRKNLSVHVHIISAFIKFGEELLTTDMEVRHLNGVKTDFSPNNLELGTRLDNIMDIPSEERRRIGAIGAVKRRILNDSEQAAFRRDRENGMTFKDLAVKYGFCHKGHASFVYRNPYKTVKPDESLSIAV